jgi:hypothetical protein
MSGTATLEAERSSNGNFDEVVDLRDVERSVLLLLRDTVLGVESTF